MAITLYWYYFIRIGRKKMMLTKVFQEIYSYTILAISIPCLNKQPILNLDYEAKYSTNSCLHRKKCNLLFH